MQKFYVTPLTPKSDFIKYLTGRNVIISHLRPDNYKLAVEICNKIYFDNGAYTYFRKNIKPDWNKFYKFLEGKKYNHFFIPDTIDGSENDNDELIKNCKIGGGIPVYHLHKSFNRLENLINNYDYIAIGSSGSYWKIGTQKWLYRMNEIMKIVCNNDGTPKCKIHMLRCLNPKIFSQYPFYSGDSSGLAQHHKIQSGDKILNNIENFNSPEKYIFKDLSYQMDMYDFL